MAGVATETTQFASDGITIKAFFAQPAGVNEAPAVVVIHEWWGLNDHIKEIARRFAAEGFVALAPDLYARVGSKVTKDPAEAGKLMESLSSQAALRDLNAAIAHLKGLPSVAQSGVGVVGFCMGGTFALMMATHNSEVKASIPFYGKVPPTETLRFLVCPVLYHYGSKDQWVTRQEVERLAQGLKDYGKPGQVCAYEADHAFFNDTRPEVYHPGHAKAAWERTLAFLREYLR